MNKRDEILAKAQSQENLDRAFHFFYTTPEGERKFGIVGIIFTIFLMLLFLPLGLFVWVCGLIWKAGSPSAEYKYRVLSERKRQKNAEMYQNYKNKAEE